MYPSNSTPAGSRTVSGRAVRVYQALHDSSPSNPMRFTETHPESRVEGGAPLLLPE